MSRAQGSTSANNFYAGIIFILMYANDRLELWLIHSVRISRKYDFDDHLPNLMV